MTAFLSKDSLTPPTKQLDGRPLLLLKDQTMHRKMNFSAGPAALPEQALERAQRELLDVDGSGMSVLEQSHRGAVYEAIHDEALALVRELMEVPDTYEIMFLQGGASQQFAVVPMNLLHQGESADYLMTGVWSKKALSEAKTIGQARVAASTEENGKFYRIPEAHEIQFDPKAAYVHMTSNNTVSGTQWSWFPDTGEVPLVVDMSSDIMAKRMPIEKFGLVYAGAQKNLGPSGLVVVLIRKDLLAKCSTTIPSIFRYPTHATAKSLYNTPPTFSIYLLRNVLLELKALGGIPTMERINQVKASTLYNTIDSYPNLYLTRIPPTSRSAMNVVFGLPNEPLEKQFLTMAKNLGMEGLKGHRLVGGIRVSLYNAVKMNWVNNLVGMMHEFAAKQGHSPQSTARNLDG
jgi:phosphoserine aminotransferase